MDLYSIVNYFNHTKKTRNHIKWLFNSKRQISTQCIPHTHTRIQREATTMTTKHTQTHAMTAQICKMMTPFYIQIYHHSKCCARVHCIPCDVSGCLLPQKANNIELFRVASYTTTKQLDHLMWVVSTKAVFPAKFELNVHSNTNSLQTTFLCNRIRLAVFSETKNPNKIQQCAKSKALQH